MTGDERAALDEELRTPIRRAFERGATAEEISFLLTRMLPELIDRRAAHGHIEAAYDLYHLRANPELDPERSSPFDRVDLD